MNKRLFRINNFDLLRLIAALQVAVNHSVEILHVTPTPFMKNVLYFSYMFPGVPVFFFISGFLISKSYESNHKLSEYFQNRFLRLYPGLLACITLSFFLIYISGYMATTDTNFFDWSLLYIAKASIVQFYNPDFMRAYGDGVLNGSLWTITVEIQFYFMIPIFYSIFKLKLSRNSNFKLISLILVFLVINRIFANIPTEYHQEIWYKLIRVSFLPWIYMFLCGIFVQKNFDFFYKYLANKFIYLIALYSIIGYTSLSYNLELGNNINPIMFIFLAATAFSFSYSFVNLSKTLLKGNDISYGAYIYHMPVVNFMLYNGITDNLSAALYALIITILIASLSWFFIEKKSLRLKKHPLNPLNQK